MDQRWIKLNYERDTYLIDLNRVSTFVWADNGRLIFWLPDGKVRMIIHPKTNPEAYQEILNYVKNTVDQSIGCQLSAQRKT